MPDESARPQWVRGRASRQAHADLPDGTVEEEHGREGFAGPASHLYRLHPPTGWLRIDGPVRPRALDANRILPSPDGRWTTLLEHPAVRCSWWSLPVGTPEWFLRHADGDVLYFTHRGEGRLETEYGPLEFRPGHYLVVPRGTTHRFVATSSAAVLVVEAIGSSVRVPDRGLLGRHALFDPAVIDVPEPAPVDERGEFEVRVLRDGAITRVSYPFHPFDVVGWKGDLAPLRLHVDDFRPVASHRYHLPPSAHTTFVSDAFVVATFAPRPLESDPDVLRVPFYHRNADYDEVILYHRGEFFSRAGITEGMLTFHPAGVHHGPQPAAVRRASDRGPGGFADEVAVNVDVRRPLRVTREAEAVDVPEYIDSWRDT